MTTSPQPADDTARTLAQLAARIARLETKTELHAAALDGLERAARAVGTEPIPTGSAAQGVHSDTERAGTATGPGRDQAEQHEPIDLNRLTRWVDDNVAHLIDRRIPTTDGAPRWCPQWWQHAEAIARFEALRLAWEDLVGQGGTAMTVYFRDYLDPTLTSLTAEAGPFARCKSGRHVGTGALGQESPSDEDVGPSTDA